MKKSWLFLLTSILAIPFALADIAETLKNVWWKILSIGNLSFLGLSDGSVVVAFTRLLIWVFVFMVFFAALVGLGKSGKTSGIFSFLTRAQSGVIAAVIATITAVFLPGQVLLAAGVGWATIISLILVGGPIVGLWYLAWNWPEGEETKATLFIKLLLSILLFWILSAMKYHVARML
ncbi:hypothetical protein HYX14_06150 [Candidatus Woesearchaeota archaeon]|nr:hypothetical protein [Candidatus Woesearchaeota archaeon]